jgi:D-lactate dehydrogenase
MLYPEIVESALIDEAREVEGQYFDGAYSLAKTCEMALSAQLGYAFESLVYLVDEATS